MEKENSYENETLDCFRVRLSKKAHSEKKEILYYIVDGITLSADNIPSKYGEYTGAEAYLSELS